MTTAIFLDSGPLGLLVHSNAEQARACLEWLDACLAGDCRVVIPEIADYEVRRELIRQAKSKSLLRLDELQGVLDYQPLTTAAMRKAAELWAEARATGRPTSDRHALDADVILCAQAHLAAGKDDRLVVATTNVGHLARFVDAKDWKDVTP